MMGIVTASERETAELAPVPVVSAEPEVAPEPVGRVLSRARVLALQRSAGNSAVTRLLQRDTTAVLNPAAPDYEQARKDRDAFVAAGKKGPQTYNPTSRNPENYYGGFDVAYDPAGEQLAITLKGGVLFLPGITLDGAGNAVAGETSAQTAAAVATINKLPPAARGGAVNAWQWSSGGGPDADDEKQFLDNFKSSVGSAWSAQHPFHATKKYWEDLGATTQVTVEVSKVATAAGKDAASHMLVNAHKVPVGFVGGDADVHRASGKTGATDNIMSVTSEDVVARKDDLLERDVAFQPGKGLLTPESVGTVWRLAKQMPNPKPGTTIEIAGLTAKVQGKDAQQRKDRFDAILDHVKQGGGVDPSRVKFVEDGEGDAGHLTVGDGKPQTVVAHESGHMFGLDDEYTGPGAYAPGKSTEHTKFAASEGMAGAMHAKSDSIMSEGAKVRPQHYTTFLDALKLVSGMNDWDFGAKQAVKPPSAAGDFPAPTPTAPDGTAVA
jgi:outer membrane protein OmpA-like peptidoglycan-associated protein